MSAGTKFIKRDAQGVGVPQYYSAAIDDFEVQQGANGGAGVNIQGSDIVLPTDKQSVYRTQADLTTTVLAANATYTGATLDGIQFRRITGFVNADQAGTLYISHSYDGSSWFSDSAQSVAVAAGSTKVFDVVIAARYVRLVYTNGATAQTNFKAVGFLSAE